ncbi:AsmA family protein (DUF3971 domain) [Poseidonibacter lekithochrous]|nr:AsmA family protein (DUF3971 domain) [Poseidonibacter lekithochrous]
MLLSGIKIDSFSFGNVNVSQFYIKLDKKLIVDIENIEISSKKSEVKNSYDDLKKNVELLPKVLKFFNSIHVERLKIDGNEFTIDINDKALYLDNKFVNLSSRLEFSDNEVAFKLYSLYLKDIKLMLDGDVRIDYFNDILSHEGKYFYKDLSGNIKLEMTKKIAKFYLDSEKFKSLKFLKKFFRLDSVAEEWMYDNVTGDIKLNEFHGLFDLVNLGIVEKSLNGTGIIDKAKIRFHKDLRTVDTEKINLKFDKGNLYFDLVKPKYDDIKLDGSFVVINNIASEKNGEVVVDIKAKSFLDKRVLEILEAYEIQLPLLQKTGLTDAHVNLKIPYLISKEMSTSGEFKSKNSTFMLNEFEFFTKNADVILDGSIVRVKNSHFKHKKMLDSMVTLDIDTSTLIAKGDALIKSFDIEDGKTKVINIKDKKTALSLDFNKNTNIYLKNLNTNINISDLIYVDIASLGKIYNQSELLKTIGIKGGSLHLAIKDENDIKFRGELRKLSFPLFKNEKQIKTLDIKGSIKNGFTKVKSDDNRIKVNVKNDDLNIYLKDLDIYIDTKSEDNTKLTDMDISGENLSLKIDDEKYYAKTVKANFNKGKITFEALAYNLDIPIMKNDKVVTSLDLLGEVDNDNIVIQTKDEKLVFKFIGENKLDAYIDGYDFVYNTESIDSGIENLDVKAIKSNIVMNEKYKFPADSYEIRIRKDSKFLHLNHLKADITYKEDVNGQIDIYANNFSDVFVNTIFDKNIVKGGTLMLLANGKKDDLKGKLILTNVKVDDLAILNNLLLFIHSSPALINPLLAVPSVVGMASNKGFTLTGYEISDGVLEFTLDKVKNRLDITKLVTVGNGIDFDGTGSVDINTLTIDSNIKLVFFKNYSKLVGAIPVVNYVLLGKNKRVSTQVKVFGPLNNPKISTNLTKDAFSVPLNIGKRILNSPIELFDFIKNKKE